MYYSWMVGPWTKMARLHYAREHIYVVDILDWLPGFWFADALEFT